MEKKLGISTISTGLMLRTAIKEQTEVGKLAEQYINDGKLVPDDVIVAIVKERLSQPDCEKGFILDGFPRTIPQAEALDTMGIEIDKVIDIEVPDEKIVERMSGRRVCPACGNSYHLLYKKPEKDGICNACGAELIIRADDHPNTVKERLDVYHSQTEPLKDFYEKKNKLFIVEGQEEVADTSALVLKALEE